VATTTAAEMPAAPSSESASTSARVAAAAPATVLGERRIRRDGQGGSESKDGKKPARRGKNDPIRRGKRHTSRKAMIAVRYARNAAGKFAFDYTAFRTIWPVGHLTLLAHWVERRRSNCNCVTLIHSTRKCTQWLQLWLFVGVE
jgi:pyruvate/2-oxoglutarate dehydrogenase complex dihydrolipoamide acyltransferase (E2) component